MVDFGGWDMPLNYGSQIEEHHAVRKHAGMFDVSHMTVVDLHGDRTREFLQTSARQQRRQAKEIRQGAVLGMLNEKGGVIDDLIVYFLTEDFFRVVVNASTRDKDLAWITQQAKAFDVHVTERGDLSMIAVQGPEAREKVQSLLSPALKEKAAKIGKFVAVEGDDLFIARTGYTGEDGYEIIVPSSKAVDLWNKLAAAGVTPAGLGARDTLAPGSRHESVRPGYGRRHHAVGSRTRLDRLARRRSRFHRPRGAGKTERRPSIASWSVW